MKTTLLVLSYVAKAAALVGTFHTIPGVSPQAAIIVFFAASLVKDTANRIDDFLTANFLPADSKSGFSRPGALLALTLAGVTALAVLGLTGCAATSSGSTGATSSGSTASTSGTSTLDQVGTDLLDAGYWAANLLQTKNDGGATLATQLGDLATSVLTATHNSGDTQTASLVTALVNKASAAVVTAQGLGATPTQQQAAVNAVLSPTSVQQTAQSVVATTPATTTTSSN